MALVMDVTGRARCYACKAEVCTVLKMVKVTDKLHTVHYPSLDRRYIQHVRPVNAIEKAFRRWFPWPWEPLPVCEGSGKEVR